jgi:hypothetical protein
MQRERRKRVSFKTCKSHFSLREEKVLLPSNFRGTQSTTKKKGKRVFRVPDSFRAVTSGVI